MKNDSENINNDQSMTFESAYQGLVDIVKKLEEGKINLSSMITYYKQAAELKKHCEKKLNEAKLTLIEIENSNNYGN